MKQISRHTALLGTLLLLLTALPAVAQTNAATAATPTDAGKTYAEKIDVNEVLLDVVVTDRKGQVVVGLDKDDFIVRENGEPVTINDVTFYSNREFLGTREEAKDLGIQADATVDRFFVLFFHHQEQLLPRLGANLLDAGRRAKQWVQSELSSNDYVAVVSYFPRYQVQDFSNDPETIAQGIDEAVQGKTFTPKEGRFSPAIPSLIANVPEGDADNIYEAIAMTAEATEKVRARKNLVLFSIGFGENESFGFYLPDNRYYPEMIQTLNDNNVAVYPIDLLATDVSPAFRATLFENVLSRMAEETGGEFYFNFVNYLSPLERIAEDNSGYYLLSYTSERDQDKGYQKVEVETENARLRARAREGYAFGQDYAYSDAPNSDS